MHPSDPFARALSAPSTLPAELTGLDSDPLWAALLTSVQNVVLGEIRGAGHAELADESRRDQWPELLDRLGHEARVRIGREIVDELSVGTVDDLWVSWMRVAGSASGAVGLGAAGQADGDPDAMGRQAVTSGDPVVQERIIDLLELLGEVVDGQLADRFGVLPDEARPDRVEFSLSDAGPAPEPVAEPDADSDPGPGPGPDPERPSSELPDPVVAPGISAPVPVAIADAGLVVSLPASLAAPPARPAAVPVFDWAPGPSHPVAGPAEERADDTIEKAPAPPASHAAPATPAQPAPAPATPAPTPTPTPTPTPPAYPAPNGYAVPPGAPGWRPLPPALAPRTPASFGRRAAAYVIDRAISILITTAAALLFIWPAAASVSSTPRPEAGGLVIALAVTGVAVVGIGWFLVVSWMTGTRGASPGKRLMRIEVVGFSSPGPIGFGRALLRQLILAAFAIGSILTAWLPYASVFWDSTKQLRGWHDKAVDDIVVDAATL